MKPLGFLISLLIHLLFFLLILTLRFPVLELEVKPQIIQIVPLSPPLTLRRPLPAPAAVYVRPFVLQGGARGKGRGPVSGKAAGTKTGLPPGSISKKNSEATTPPVAPTPGAAAAALPGSGLPSVSGHRSKLTIDLERISQRLREQQAAGERSDNPAFAADQPVESLPFSDPAAGGGDVSPSGDGTSSHAFGGNAFFDSRGYDITPWAKRMVYRVKKNWIFPPVSEFGLKGVVGIYLLIRRDGAIENVHIRKTSGIRPFDQAAFNAIELSLPLPPLPDDFPHKDLPAYLLFYYN